MKWVETSYGGKSLLGIYKDEVHLEIWGDDWCKYSIFTRNMDELCEIFCLEPKR